MKRTFLICACAFLAILPTASGAQSIAELLEDSVLEKEKVEKLPAVKINIDALHGDWNYSGAAVEFTGSDLMAVLGSTVAAPALRQTLETYYARAGVVKGSSAIRFGEETYTAKHAGGSVNGPYRFDARDQKMLVTYDHPALGGCGTMVGKLTFTGERLLLMFEADKIVTMIREMTAGSTLDQDIRDLMDIVAEYRGLYLGFELEK